MKRRKYILGAAALTAMVILILDSRCMRLSAEDGVMLCLKSLIPSLFPFLFLSGIITDLFWSCDGRLLRYLGKLFRLPEGTASLLIPSFLGGYPAGAQIIAENYTGGRIPKEEAQRLLAYCSNAGPSFLFGIAAVQFPDASMVWYLWLIHILSAGMVSRCFPVRTSHTASMIRKKQSFSDHLTHSVRTMSIVCGWVILFRVLLGFLDKWFLWYFPEEIRIGLWGLLELSNGCCSLFEIQSVQIRFILCSGMLSFGGLCVTMQTASLISDLSLTGYLKGKAFQTGFSLVFSALTMLGFGWIVGLAALIWLLCPLICKKEVAFCGIPVYNAGIISSEGAT